MMSILDVNNYLKFVTTKKCKRIGFRQNDVCSNHTIKKKKLKHKKFIFSIKNYKLYSSQNEASKQPHSHGTALAGLANIDTGRLLGGSVSVRATYGCNPRSSI